ncbi:MAG: arsenate reductase (glutaredoxin) [Ekhidna sp.]
MMTIYHNPRCSKSRQTLNLIEDKGQTFEIKEYLKDPPSKEELKKIIALLGIKPEQLIRKGEADFKENFKGKNMTDDEWIDAMIAYPKLMERPIVVDGDRAVLGRPPENVLTLL